MAGQAPIEQQDLTVSDRYLSMATTDGIDGRKLGTWRKAIPPLCRADAHLGPVWTRPISTAVEHGEDCCEGWSHQGDPFCKFREAYIHIRGKLNPSRESGTLD